jgi:heme A synthase
VQVTLGALTVLSRRDPWINSFHVVCGAMVLTTSLVLTLRAWRGRFAEMPLAAKLARSLGGPGAAAANATATNPTPSGVRA